MGISHRSLAIVVVVLLQFVASTSHAEVRSFRNPQYQGYRLDYCQSFGKICGEPVATQWCRGLGYEHASDWAIDSDLGEQRPTMTIGDDRVCRGNQCDGFASISCGREGRSFRLPNIGAATRSTLITPDRRGTAPDIEPVEVQLLVPGCYQAEPGVLLCGTVHEYQHCRSLFAAGKLLGCRAGLAFDSAFARPEAAALGSYELDLHSRASATVTRGLRGDGRLRGDARYRVSFSVPGESALAENCLQRDRYVYYPSGPRGGLSQIDDTSDCSEPIEGRFEPDEDDLLRAYDLCEAHQAWGTKLAGSIELLVAGLYSVSPSAGADGVAGASRIVAPYITIRAPFAVTCKN